MKWFGNTKKLIDQTKNEENIQFPKVIHVDLVQCKMVGNQY